MLMPSRGTYRERRARERVQPAALSASNMSNVGMSNERCQIYMSNYLMTKLPTDPMVHGSSGHLVIWSLGRLTYKFDIVHWTSQHLTYWEHPPAYWRSWSGASGEDPPRNSVRPSGSVRSLPLARCVPSFDR